MTLGEWISWKLREHKSIQNKDKIINKLHTFALENQCPIRMTKMSWEWLLKFSSLWTLSWWWGFFFFSDVLHSFWQVLRNIPWLIMTFTAVCAIFLIVSLVIQMTKYLQLQFHLQASKASLLVGEYPKPYCRKFGFVSVSVWDYTTHFKAFQVSKGLLVVQDSVWATLWYEAQQSHPLCGGTFSLTHKNAGKISNQLLGQPSQHVGVWVV